MNRRVGTAPLPDRAARKGAAASFAETESTVLAPSISVRSACARSTGKRGTRIAVRDHCALSHTPQIPGYPNLDVLERNGSLLHSQNTVELEGGSSYNEGAILGFLEEMKGKRRKIL